MDFTFLLVLATLTTGVLSLVHTNISTLKNVREFSSSIFPVLFVVLILRSFFIEPYKIPSGSMIPTLMIGDFILVDKNIYGYKIPLTNITLFENENPKRGDVVVFKYPEDQSINYIKRVIGLPGDKILYKNKRLYINDSEYPLIKVEHSFDPIEIADGHVFIENNLQKEYMILNQSNPPFNFEYYVPNGTYFVLGDNRDNSNDSRFWGPVPEENLVGKAFYIWMFWNSDSYYSFFDRVGTKIE
ncbi:MAG: signal peptidase I [Pseudomonadota bacterium]|nr:signal peptidase I [Pseudomonadota bacterium]